MRRTDGDKERRRQRTQGPWDGMDAASAAARVAPHKHACSRPPPPTSLLPVLIPPSRPHLRTPPVLMPALPPAPTCRFNCS